MKESSTSQKSVSVSGFNTCVLVQSSMGSICQQGSAFVAGKHQIPLAGNTTGLVSGKHYALSGYLVEGVECTFFFVQRAKECNFPTTA